MEIRTETFNLSGFNLFSLQYILSKYRCHINDLCETQCLQATKSPFLAYNQKHKREGISLFNMMVTIWNPYKDQNKSNKNI